LTMEKTSWSTPSRGSGDNRPKTPKRPVQAPNFQKKRRRTGRLFSIYVLYY
jgi:hypothetical protein